MMKPATHDRIRIFCMPLAPVAYAVLRVTSFQPVPWVAWTCYFLALPVLACGLVSSVSMVFRRNPLWLRAVAFVFIVVNGMLLLGLLERLVI